jgi:uncharacterized membrane protein YphA (DoxX/SURF4 family)
MRTRAAISTVARVVLGLVLLMAGALKIADPQSAVAAVRAYQLLPELGATLVGWGLPFVELLLGLLLLSGLATRPVAIATAVLLVIFLAGVISVAARGLSIDCGCFGGGGPVPPDQTAYGLEIARQLGLLALAGWLAVYPQSYLSLDPTPRLRGVSTTDRTQPG